MKKYLLASFIIVLTNLCFAQTEIKDSIFVRIDKLSTDQYSYSLSQGKINGVHIYVKNDYENYFGFASGYFKSDLILKPKDKIDQKKIVEYDVYNEMLNKDLINIYLHYKTYFIISEDKYNYLILQVRPIIRYLQ